MKQLSRDGLHICTPLILLDCFKIIYMTIVTVLSGGCVYTVTVGDSHGHDQRTCMQAILKVFIS